MKNTFSTHELNDVKDSISFQHYSLLTNNEYIVFYVDPCGPLNKPLRLKSLYGAGKRTNQSVRVCGPAQQRKDYIASINLVKKEAFNFGSPLLDIK